MKNILLAIVAIIAIILIFLSFQNDTETSSSNNINEQTNKQKKVEIKKKDIEIKYIKEKKRDINKPEIAKKAKKINLSPEEKKIVSLIEAGKFTPTNRVYKSLDDEYEAKIYIPKSSIQDSNLPPSIPKVIEITAPSGSVIPITIEKKVKKSIIVKFRDKNSGNVSYKKVDIDSNMNDNTEITPPPMPPPIK